MKILISSYITLKTQYYKWQETYVFLFYLETVNLTIKFTLLIDKEL